jgi:glycosyltransferase involved in cell wall biosynthesis
MARICLVTHYMPPHRGGVERVAQQLARRYAAAGHAVEWLATAGGAPTGPARDGAIALERLAGANALERRAGMPFPLLGPVGARAIARAVRRADLVHLHDCLYLPVLVADRAARRARVPTLVTQHVGMVGFGPLVDPVLLGAYRTVGRRVLRHASQVAFVNAGVRDWFHERIDPAIGGEHIPNGVDLARFRPPSDAERGGARAALGLDPALPVVLFAGRLVPKKNLGALVAALRTVAGPWQLLVVGDGPHRSALARERRIVHVPDLPHGRMPEAYAAADLFALPSRDEGTPLTVLEALASGLPVVTSDDPAFRELGDCGGVRQAPATAAGLATVLAPLLGRSDLRATAGRASRARAERDYDEARIAARYLALVDDLTAAR